MRKVNMGDVAILYHELGTEFRHILSPGVTEATHFKDSVKGLKYDTDHTTASLYKITKL